MNVTLKHPVVGYGTEESIPPKTAPDEDNNGWNYHWPFTTHKSHDKLDDETEGNKRKEEKCGWNPWYHVLELLPLCSHYQKHAEENVQCDDDQSEYVAIVQNGNACLY